MNAEPRTPEERLVRDVVENATAVCQPNQPTTARRRANQAVRLWRRHDRDGLPAGHAHRGLFHAVGHARERRASLGNRVHTALEQENRPAAPAVRQAVIRRRGVRARARALGRSARKGVGGLER